MEPNYNVLNLVFRPVVCRKNPGNDPVVCAMASSTIIALGNTRGEMLPVATLNYNDLGRVVQTAATVVWPLPERPVNQGRHDLRDIPY